MQKKSEPNNRGRGMIEQKSRRRWVGIEKGWILAVAAALSGGACSPDGGDADPLATEIEAVDVEPGGLPEPAETSPSAAMERTQTASGEELARRLEFYLDSADRRLRRVPGLTQAERTALRRDVNARHLERARQLGRRVTGDHEPLVRSGRLVPLADTTALWVVRELDYSVPYVTPDTEAMLAEIGERFHARLDSLGIPRYRLDITSVLRTPETQAALRRTNRNASRIESAHEFGTTLDIAYRRYAPPAEHPASGLDGTDDLATQADSLLIETGRLRGTEFQAVLGRVLLEMQREGKLLVMMERSQTVYHITVGRRFSTRRAAG
jgi:hypothetical protein